MYLPLVVSDTAGESSTDASSTSGGSSTALNALVGGVAGIVLSFIPMSTVLGGAVAGYLEGGRPGSAWKVGAIAGAVMLLPFVFFGTIAATFFFGVGGPGPGLAFGPVLVVVLLFAALYTVVLGALGGVLGAYLRDEL